MKKLFALVLSFCLLCSVAFAEGETATDAGNGENKTGSLNLGSLPERKTVNSLTDVLTSEDAERIQKAISDALVSFAEKDEALSLEAWSEKVLQEKMENASKARITEIAQEIQDTIRETEEQNKSLQEAVNKGESKKSWLDGQIKKYITKAVELRRRLPAADVTAGSPLQVRTVKGSPSATEKPAGCGKIWKKIRTPVSKQR